MRSWIMLCALAGCLATATAVTAKPEVVRQIPVDGTFGENEITGNEASGYVYRIKILGVNGVIEVCGAGFHRNARVREPIRRYMRGLELRMDGKPILKDFTFFNDVKSAKALDSAKANCVRTGARAPRNQPEFTWHAKRVLY